MMSPEEVEEEPTTAYLELTSKQQIRVKAFQINLFIKMLPILSSTKTLVFVRRPLMADRGRLVAPIHSRGCLINGKEVDSRKGK